MIIGGLAIGGAGKTPVVEALARRAHASGRRVAVVGHGYRARLAAPLRLERPNLTLAGDEASALRRTLPAEIEVWVGRDRADVIRRAGEGRDLVLVDGGFQSPRLPRTADLVVVDATAPRAVFPAGPLREPLGALDRADLVWLHNADRGPTLPADITSRLVPVDVVSPTGESLGLEWLRGRAVAPICGIARPDGFVVTLRALGAQCAPVLDVVDHGRFPQSVRRPRPDGRPRITTTKDRERLPSGVAFVLVVRVEIISGADRLSQWVG